MATTNAEKFRKIVSYFARYFYVDAAIILAMCDVNNNNCVL